MNRKDTMLRLFRMKRDFTEDRIRNGIETNRKSFAFLEFSDSEVRVVKRLQIVFPTLMLSDIPMLVAFPVCCTMATQFPDVNQPGR